MAVVWHSNARSQTLSTSEHDFQTTLNHAVLDGGGEDDNGAERGCSGIAGRCLVVY